MRKGAASAVLSAAFLAITATSEGSHVRPRGATPVVVPVVIGYYPCTAPNSTHGAPLAYPSCSPPRPLNPYTTFGTPDANGAPAKSIGSFRLDVIPGDFRMSFALSDVRCLPGTATDVCNSPNAADGPDYSGNLLPDVNVRITDHNTSNGSGGEEATTLWDIPIALSSFAIPCQNTTDTTIGAQCGTTTTYDTMIPGAVVAGKRTVVELGQIGVAQAGPSGHETNPYGFTREGLFVP